jgi:DNA-binding CsgD family transcriptional regulator
MLNATRHASALSALTARERDVLVLMAEGRSNSAIADRLVVSERAVEKHISNIFSKLGLSPSDSDHRRVLAVLAYLEPWPIGAFASPHVQRTIKGPSLRIQKIRIQKPRYSAWRLPGNHTTFPARIAAADRSHFMFKGEESRGNGVAFPVLSQHGFLTCVQPTAPGHVGVA